MNNLIDGLSKNIEKEDINMEEKIRELIEILELKQQIVIKDNSKELSQYLEGRIDGLNVAIRELEGLLKQGVNTKI